MKITHVSFVVEHSMLLGRANMWLDNASNIDLLFYSPYADTIVNFARTSELTPLTIGLYGSWGAGKSSLLQLIEAKIKSQDTKIACVSLNAWQFENYEDAKVAIMEALLKALKDNKTVFESAGEKIKGLLARINYFKIGKDLLFKGAPYAIGAITGNPLPIAVNLSADLLTSTNISEKLQNFSDQYIKSADSESITENIRKFRDEFEKMLADVKSIDNLVVIIDDLDRCSPDRIIDTLEAIKLFLSVKKTTFIVAVDQRIIEYAVKTKYPQIEGFDISSDYIEKIIQLPIKIPELSSKDIENYLLLLICQLQLKKVSFQTLIETIHSQRILLKETPLAWDVIEPLLDKTRSEFELSYNMNTLKSEIECISEIAHIVSGSLKGNPRQTKRFLNTFYVRKSLAALYFGEEISLPILAKLLAIETIDSRAFKKLYEWNSGFNGEIAQLKFLETAASEDKDFGEEYSLWMNPRIIRWLKSKPTDLYTQDLSKYFYLSRESLGSAESITASFTEAERKMLSAIQHCIPGQEDSRIKELKEMEPVSQSNVCESLLAHFRDDNLGLNIISRIFETYSDRQTDIVEILLSKPKTFFGMGTVPHIKRMYKANSARMKACLEKLETDKKINQSYTNQIAGDTVAFATAQRR